MSSENKSLADLGWQEVQGHLSRRCHSARGAAVALEISPLAELQAATDRIEVISEIRFLRSQDCRLPFGGLADIEIAVARSDKGGVLSDEELMTVAGTARALGRLHRIINEHRDTAPRLAELGRDLVDLKELQTAIDRAYGGDGLLSDQASERLGPLRREARRKRDQLAARMDSVVGELDAHLQDRYFTQRGERFVVPVRVSARARVPGIVHGTSQSGQTVFVEPSVIVDLGNHVKLAECAVADEEERIRSVLSRQVAAVAAELIEGSDAATYLDLLDAGASLAEDLGGCAPQISEGESIDLRQARHPLMVLANKPCVANDVLVQANSTLLISGPNAGGKTVALKTTGLAVLMARAGLHIAAQRGSVLPWISEVYTDIGDAQSLDADLSTFSGHVANLRRLLGRSGHSSLVLIDEIAVGTEPEQGAALAQAILETLADRGGYGIVTTHYERLKALAAEDPRFANASVGFDMEALAPTFCLHLGVPGSSGALVVARQLGVDEAIVRRAQELLGTGRAEVEQMLIEVSAERDRLQTDRLELESALRDAEREKARAQLAREEAQEAKRRIHHEAHSDAVASLREARIELEDLRQRAKGASTSYRELDRKIDAMAGQVREAAPAPETDLGAVPSAGELGVGTAVVLASTGTRGKVVSAPQRGMVTVQVGNMKTTVAIAQVRLSRNVSHSTKTVGKSWSSKQTVTASNESDTSERASLATLDLRGTRVDEALDSVDRFIDSALLREQSTLWIIHGHGTGALRRAVRQHARAHKLVSQHRPGERREGGDGVTVLILDC